MSRRRAAALAVLLPALLGAGAAPPSASLAVSLAAAPSATSRPSPAATLALMRRVADWQLAHFETFDYVRGFNRSTAERRGWVQASFLIGLTALADRDPRYAAAILAQGERERWALGERPMHADDHAIGQVWLWAAARGHAPARYAPLKARFDAILADPPTDVSLVFEPAPPPGGGRDQPCQVRWCWCDALFMSPPAWAGLTKATGDRRYLAHADREYWATAQVLLDPDEQLFYRDTRYLPAANAGRKVFWSRGNAWVFAGLARMLEALPAHDPLRPRYEALYRRMAARLIALQKPDGYWAPSLLEQTASPPETSGTAFYVFALAYGLNHGLLDRTTYLAPTLKGWSAVTRAVGPDGRVGWVQQIGSAPDSVRADDTQLYGAGAALLAGSEMMRLR